MTADNSLRLCSTEEVDSDQPLLVEVDGFAYSVSRVGEDFFVTADLCSHGPGSLSEGFMEGYEVTCPFHGGRFDVRTGEASAAPCWEPILAWDTVVENGVVYIDSKSPKATPGCKPG